MGGRGKSATEKLHQITLHTLTQANRSEVLRQRENSSERAKHEKVHCLAINFTQPNKSYDGQIKSQRDTVRYATRALWQTRKRVLKWWVTK